MATASPTGAPKTKTTKKPTKKSRKPEPPRQAWFVRRAFGSGLDFTHVDMPSGARMTGPDWNGPVHDQELIARLSTATARDGGPKLMLVVDEATYHQLVETEAARAAEKAALEAARAALKSTKAPVQ